MTSRPGMSACKLRLEPDEQNPDLFFFKPLEAAGRVAVSAAAGRRTSRFFLDPKGRLTREVGDWLHLAERCYLGGTPVPPLYINGLVKHGKSYLLNTVLPALARTRNTGTGGGSGGQQQSHAHLPEPNFLPVNCFTCTRIGGVAGFLRGFLFKLKGSAAMQQLSAAASTTVPGDLSERTMLAAIRDFMQNLPQDRLNFLLIDEVHSFYLLEQRGEGDGGLFGSPLLDWAEIRSMRSVFKELLLESPPWIAWAVTGGNMATVWANVVATPDNGGLPLAAHRCRVDLDAVASRETLAVAWRQLQTKHAAEHPPLPADLVWQSPQHHATLAYLCGEWEYQGGHTVHTAAELVRQSRLWKLIPQVLADLQVALPMLGQPAAQLRLLRDLLDPLTGVPRHSLPPAFKEWLGSYTTLRGGRLYMDNLFLTETLQAVTAESGELVTGIGSLWLPA